MKLQLNLLHVKCFNNKKNIFLKRSPVKGADTNEVFVIMQIWIIIKELVMNHRYFLFTSVHEYCSSGMSQIVK